jgi:uncharacterized protein (TIGR00266 family)
MTIPVPRSALHTDNTLLAKPKLSDARQNLVKALKLAAVQQTFSKQPRELDFDVVGQDIQSLNVHLKPGQILLAEPGAMIYASPDLDIKTLSAAAHHKPTDFWSQLNSGFRRMAAGNSFFLTQYNAEYQGGTVHVSPSSRGKIIPVHLKDTGNLLCHRNTFLCSDNNVVIDAAWAPRLGAGILGGQGLVLQKLTGHGTAFLHAGGNVIVKDLKRDERLLIDHSAVVARTESVDYSIRRQGASGTFLGGEGLFMAELTGPGRVYLQTHPEKIAASNVAHSPGISIGLHGLKFGMI